MKKFLLSLCVGFLGVISFCNAGTYTIEGNVKDGFNSIMVVPQSYYSPSFSVHCVFSSENINCEGGNIVQFGFKFAQIYSSSYLYSTSVNTNNNYVIGCDSPSDIIIDYDFSTYIPSSSGPYASYYGVSFIDFANFWASQGADIPYSCTFVGNNILSAGSCPDCPVCDDPYTSMECQSEYNLIPISDIDINYCVGNGLCPTESGSGTDLTGDLQYSDIYINNILHPGRPNIFVNIPDYITWDYSFDDSDFNLYVGSGYDVDYINSIVDINSYRPSSDDFTNIFVSGLTLIFPYIFIALLILFIWKLVKRIFK